MTFNIYAKEAEAAVLGSLMTFEDALAEVSLILTPEMFYDLRHQCIYTAILKTDNDGIPVDLVSVAEALKKTGNLERAGNYIPVMLSGLLIMHRLWLRSLYSVN